MLASIEAYAAMILSFSTPSTTSLSKPAIGENALFSSMPNSFPATSSPPPESNTALGIAPCALIFSSLRAKPSIWLRGKPSSRWGHPCGRWTPRCNRNRLPGFLEHRGTGSRTRSPLPPREILRSAGLPPTPRRRALQCGPAMPRSWYWPPETLPYVRELHCRCQNLFGLLASRFDRSGYRVLAGHNLPSEFLC